MAEPAQTELRFPMTDADMHAFLKASVGVTSCNIKAQTLFDSCGAGRPAQWLLASRVWKFELA